MPDANPGLSYWTAHVKDPHGPVAKIKLSDLMNYDARAGRRHKRLWEFHLGWSVEKYEHTSLASVRMIQDVLRRRSPFGEAMSARHVSEGNRDLCAWGYLVELEKGSGKRASRYVPNWGLLDLAATGGFPPSVSPVGNTTENGLSVSPVGNACVSPVGNTNASRVSPVGNEDLSIRTTLQDVSTEIERAECAAPTAPPAPAPVGGSAAGSAQDEKLEPFERLWRAYGFKKKKPEARAAFAKIAPDAELLETILDAARAWQTSWAAQNKPDAPRYTLAKWLDREDFECEPPTAYKPKEMKAANENAPRQKSKGGVSSILRVVEAEGMGSVFGDYRVRLVLDGDGQRREHILRVRDENGSGDDAEIYSKLSSAFGSESRWPGSRLRLESSGSTIMDFIPEAMPERVVAIAETEIVKEGKDMTIAARLVNLDGSPEGWLDICYESFSESIQAEGQRQLSSLCRAIGVGEVEDTSVLHGRPFLLTSRGAIQAAPLREAA